MHKHTHIGNKYLWFFVKFIIIFADHLMTGYPY